MNNNKPDNIYNEILDQLDAATKNYKFPIFDNPNYPVAAMRIICFKDSSEWIILFERIAYWTAEGKFVNMVSTFSNKIKNPGLHSILEIIKESPKMPMWDEEMNFTLNKNSFEIIINEKLVHFSLVKEDFEKSHVNDFPEMDKALRLLRVITYKLGEELFMDPFELLKRINHKYIPVFLIVTEWNHPDVNAINPELPSSNRCFQAIAKAIAFNESSLFICNDYINSKWYDWEE